MESINASEPFLKPNHSSTGSTGSSFSSLPYLQAVLLFDLAVYIFHTYLDVRQLRAIKLPNPPDALKEVTDPKEFRKTQSYQLDKW